MKLKRRKLVELEEALAMAAGLKGVKFAYAAAKNHQKIESELKAMRKGLEPTEKYKEYDEERIALCREHADKDEKDRPKMRPSVSPGVNTFVGLDGNEDFEKALNTLQKKYKKELDEAEERRKEYEAFLDDEIDFTFFKVAKKFVPEDITVGLMIELIDMIDESENPSEPTKAKNRKKRRG